MQSYGATANEAMAQLGLKKLNRPVHSPDTDVAKDRLKRELRDVRVPHDAQYSSRRQYAKIRRREGCYPMVNSPRGRALVVIMTGGRKGWQGDIKALHKMLLYLDIQVQYEFDLGGKELVGSLDRFASGKSQWETDCNFVVLMGHGGKIGCGDVKDWEMHINKEYLQTADGYAFFLHEELPKFFDNRKHDYLQGIPKIFLVQMCRGGTELRTKKSQRNTWNMLYNSGTSSDVPVVIVPDAPWFTDYLIGFATQSGMPSYRVKNQPDQGSLFIQEVCRVFLEQAADRQVTNMLDQVNNRLDKLCARKSNAQVPEYKSTLRHPLFFFPGLHERGRLPLEPPVLELLLEVKDAWDMVGVAHQGALVARNELHGPYPELVRLASDGSQQGAAYRAEDLISTVIPQDDTLLLLEADGYISRRPLHKLSRTTATWCVDAGVLKHGAALSRDLLVCVDMRRGEVFTCSLRPDGTVHKQVKVTGLDHPYRVACTGTGDDTRIAVVEPFKHQVLVYDATWQLQATIGGKGQQDGQPDHPYDCTFLPSGNLLVADTWNHRVSEFHPQGGLVRHWLTTDQGLYKPFSISFISPHLWVVHSNQQKVKTISRFKIFG